MDEYNRKKEDIAKERKLKSPDEKKAISARRKDLRLAAMVAKKHYSINQVGGLLTLCQLFLGSI
jgi:hypothetical protein